MDTIYFQNDTHRGPGFWVNEPVEGTEGKMRLNGLRGHPDTRAGFEHRRHKRFRVKVCAFALIRSANSKPLEIPGRGMGEIACAVFRSRPAKLGRINDISMGGLMFHYVDHKVPSKESTVLDILLADCRFYLENLRFRSISDLLLPDEFPGGSLQMRRLRVEFDRLASYQIAGLEYFVSEIRSRSKKTFDLDHFVRSSKRS